MNYEALKDYLNENDSYSRLSHISVVKLEPGKSEVVLTVCPENRNFMGFLHGGAYYTLADVAGGCALVQRNRKCVTLQADLHYLRKAYEEEVIAYGECIHLGKTTGVSHVEIKDRQGRCIAVCTCTMFFTDEPLFPEEM